jgi:hypothetical protein
VYRGFCLLVLNELCYLLGIMVIIINKPLKRRTNLVDFSYNFIVIKYEDSCKFIKYNQKVNVNQVKLASKIGVHINYFFEPLLPLPFPFGFLPRPAGTETLICKKQSKIILYNLRVQEINNNNHHNKILHFCVPQIDSEILFQFQQELELP